MTTHPSFSFSYRLPARRAFGVAALALLLAGAAPNASASAQPTNLDGAVVRLESAETGAPTDLWLAPEYRRAVRTARTGGTLLGLSLTSVIVGGGLMHRGANMECASGDGFCGWGQAMSGTGLVIFGAAGSALSAIVLGIGVARRNRLDAEAHRTYALRAGLGSLEFNMSF